jgi:very-short-patch-repair endonuclease
MPTTIAERKSFRRQLEHRATQAERAFQERLLDAKIGHQFQVVIGPFIVDFWVPKKLLVIELDGGYHWTPERINYDKRRDAFFAKHNIQTIRIPNEEATTFPIQSITDLPEPKPRGIHLRRIQRFIKRRESATRIY